jgi:2-polyprenyl-3-methyl-5-hydroxy-6-metoxy-1,4-benzoquinol methylase
VINHSSSKNVESQAGSKFDFGSNWRAFSEHALSSERVAQAKRDFRDLFCGIDLKNRSFLDVGFGQGLSLLIATTMGANTVGCDVNPLCAEVLQQNELRYFPELSDRTIPIIIGSILDDAIIEQLRAKSADHNVRAYDIVHSWGAVHHTGDMRRAIANVASLVCMDGYLVLAIYARHWSSGGWRVFKRFYNRSPEAIQRLLLALLYPVIYVAKWLATRRNPLKQTRGMDFYYDLLDWAGGYPYEYATVDEVGDFLKSLGFKLQRCIPASVPTGCNQFLFRLEGVPVPEGFS